MAVTVQHWTGRETRILRQAARMSLREFAARLGFSERTISKWEAAGADIHPRPSTQAILDTALEMAGAEVQQRFAAFHRAASAIEDLEPSIVEPDAPSPITRMVRHLRDGKDMAMVTAGVFPFGSCDEPLWLDDFYIDTTLVTNHEYANFVAATGYEAPRHWEGTRPDASIRNLPVVHVTHRDATAYANWAGKALPSVEQWEKAARGEQGNLYPWGDQPTEVKCNVRESGPGNLTPVDCYRSGTSVYGVYDLAGNTWEWCSTPTSSGRYILKGSAFTSSFDMASSIAVNDANAGMSDDDTSFRTVAIMEPL